MRTQKVLFFPIILTLFCSDFLLADDDPMCWTCSSCSQNMDSNIVDALSANGFHDDGLCKTVLPIYADRETSILGSYGSLIFSEEAQQRGEYLRKCTYQMRTPNDQPFGKMVIYKGLSVNAPAICDYLLGK